MSDAIKSYRDLEVWQRGISLAKTIYEATSNFPTQERFGLINQMRRAAVSVPSNIAEGHARASTVEYCRYVSISMGSIAELETQVIISRELTYLPEPVAGELLTSLDELGKMLRGLHRALQRK